LCFEHYNRGVLPFLWVQKYSYFFNPTTPRQKNLFFLRTSSFLIWFISLPLWALATPQKTGFFSVDKAPVMLAQAQRADSLFERGQYEAAIPLYRAQVWQQRQASARLLVRLAYAEHQQAHYAAELLYLNMALARQPRLSTWRQLAALAQRQRLVGYPTTWQQEVRVQVLRYYYPVLQGLLTLAVLVAVGLLLRRRRTGRGTWLAYGLYLLATGAYLYWLRPVPTGIVARPGVALMAGPGAGAAWLSTAAPGDRLPVLGRQDIWLRVRWQERVAYVRAADAFVIE
jgi:tetratricopeptide (TPR) repeat protein